MSRLAGYHKPLRVLLALYWVALFMGSHWPRLKMGQNNALPVGMDKWLHVGGYAGLMFLMLMSSVFAKSPKRNLVIALVVGVIYSVFDELTQVFVDRELHFADWVASFTGLMLGVGSFYFAKWVLTDWGDEPALVGEGEALVKGARGDSTEQEVNVDDDQEERGRAKSFVSNTKVVALLTLLSRVFGLMRDWSLAVAFGFAGVMDAFVIAFMVPNLFRRLFGEGALAAAFIPHYTKLDKVDRESASVFARRVIRRMSLFTMLIVLGVVVVLGVMLSLGWVGEKWVLTSRLSMVTLWYAPLVCCVALLGAMLQVHGRFGPPAAAPVILNLFIIATSVYVWIGAGNDAEASEMIYLVVGGVIVAGAFQFVWQLVALRKTLNRFKLWGAEGEVDSVRLGEAMGGLLKQWGPTVLGLAVLQFNTLFDMLIAKGFSGGEGETMNLFGNAVKYPMTEGAASVLASTARLYEFPLGVFGIAVATAIFPALSRTADDALAFGKLLRQGLRLTIYIGLPVSIGLILVREPLAKAIYGEAGALSAEDYARVATVLLGYAPAIWAYSMNHILTRAFYAKENAVTPVRVAIGMVGLNLVLNLTLIWFMGVLGLAVSTAICACLQAVILMVLVKRYVPQPVDYHVLRSWMVTMGMTVVIGLCVGGFLAVLDVSLLNRVQTIMVLGVAVIIGMVVMGLISRVLKLDELRWLIER